MNPPVFFDPWQCSRLCLTLVHSLWQVPIIVLLVDLVSRVVERNKFRFTRGKYGIQVAGLVVSLLALPITFALVQVPPNSGSVVVYRSTTFGLADSAPTDGERAASQLNNDSRARTVPADHEALDGSTYWLRITPWLIVIYLIGAMLMLGRLVVGLVYADQLRRRAEPIVNGPLADWIRSLSAKWSLRVVPVLAQADRIVVPKVVGLLRPTILLPTSALSGLTMSELEMFVAHELAHVRRLDMWINLLQRLAEVLLFFNPALWFLSRTISLYREYSCDELACTVSSTMARKPYLPYAAALLKLAELSGLDAAVQRDLAVLAADGGSPSQLRRRIARLFGEPDRDSLRISRGGALLVLVSALLLLGSPAIWRASGQSNAAADQDQSAHRAEDSTAIWVERLVPLTIHNQTAFDVGPRMIGELPAEEAWEAVRRAWPQLKSDDVKTGVLKAFAFARHPRVLEVLDLGARDESADVRDYAYSYLANYAMRAFKERQHDYQKWQLDYAGKPVDDVIRENTKWFVERLRGDKPGEDLEWWRSMEEFVNLRAAKTSYPQKAHYLREAGFVELLTSWRDDPASSAFVKEHATAMIALVHKSSLAVDEAHQQAQLQEQSLASLTLDRGVDDLLAKANLSTSDLANATLIGGAKAFFGTDFSRVCLIDSLLVGRSAFQKAQFDGADLTNAVLRGDGAGFQMASFRGAKLVNARLTDGTSSFQVASFEDADLTRATLQGGAASFQESNFDNAKLVDTTIICTGVAAFQAVSLNNTDFSGAVLTTIDAGALRSCKFDATTPPRYSEQTQFPKGFDPKRAGWTNLDDK